MDLFKQKKGVVFIVIALTISIFVLLMFFYMYELPLDHSVEVTRTRVRSVNSFLSQVDGLVTAQAVSSSRTAINDLIEGMYEEESFFSSGDDFDNQFLKCLQDGDFEFEGSGQNYPCRDESQFIQIIEEDLRNFLLDNIGLKVEFDISNIELSQPSHWDLNISFDINILITEEQFVWDLNLSLWDTFSIVGLKDPVHAVPHVSLLDYGPDTFEDVVTISFHELSRNITSDWKEKTSTLNELSKNNNYFEHPDYGVSYIDRLRGVMGPSEHGILRVQLPFYEDSEDYDTVVRKGVTDIDWQFWQDNHPVIFDSIGEYNFTRTRDIIEVLGLTSAPFDLSNTLHKVRLPVALAEQANVSGDTYFYD